MANIAFVFPGQGAQAPGMGRSFFERSPAAKAIFDLAEKVRPGTVEQCFEGDAEELKRTDITQPCLYTVELAIAAALRECGVTPAVTAGFSLGELSALTFAGAFDIISGVKLVVRRGELMQKAAEQTDAAMVAVMKLDDDKVRGLCAEYPGVYPVNFNCDGQVVVSCKKELLDNVSLRVKEAGGRALPLAVGGGFHSPFMQSAAEAFGEVLADVAFGELYLPVYANLSALPYADGGKPTLARQITSPVLWKKTIENMIHDGADTFIECGPGKVLTGLIKRINPQVRIYNIETYEDSEQVKGVIAAC